MGSIIIQRKVIVLDPLSVHVKGWYWDAVMPASVVDD